MDVMCQTNATRINVSGGIYGDADHGLEDDAFYQELVRQILILTADDDDDSTASNVGYFDSTVSRPAATRWLTYDVPTWPWRNNNNNNGTSSGGTGVFIPQTRTRDRYAILNFAGRRGSNKHKQQEQKTVQS
ncbi:hypothetical protein LINPERPRIM_LOCUS6228 [Linum perenne]